MSAERHKCRLCSKNFPNGRALGGHMRSHLLPLPPAKRTRQKLTESDSSSSNSRHNYQQEEEAKGEAEYGLERHGVPSYGLREDPKKRARASDPEFLDAGSSVVLHEEDRLSEIESAQNPTRKQRSKRAESQAKEAEEEVGLVSAKLGGAPVTSDSVTESVPVSSVSDGTSRDEEVALCLMMLSMDKWVKEEESAEGTNESSELLKAAANNTNNIGNKPSRAKYKCSECRKNFRSQKALSGHMATSRMCQEQNAVEQPGSGSSNVAAREGQKIYECPFCLKVFGSGQALGGHKRSHLLVSTAAAASTPPAAGGTHNSSSPIVDRKAGSCSFDLNLPAPVEDDGFPVVI